MRSAGLTGLLAILCGAGSAQSVLHELSVGAGGLFPVSGYKTDSYATGPALRAGYQLRVKKHIGAEVGWTGTWPNQEAVRHQLQFIDYGLRGIVPVARDRAELSAGIGGGYVVYDQRYPNSDAALLQFSGRVAAPVDARRSFWVGITFRMWRDLGRPTQQWLTTTGELTYQFGH